MSDRGRYILRCDGTREEVPEPIDMTEVERRIGAEILDHVMLRHLGRPPMVMCVDDKGYEAHAVEHDGITEMVPTRALKPVNAEATRLYHANCLPGATHQIVGDVYICPDDDYA